MNLDAVIGERERKRGKVRGKGLLTAVCQIWTDFEEGGSSGILCNN